MKAETFCLVSVWRPDANQQAAEPRQEPAKAAPGAPAPAPAAKPAAAAPEGRTAADFYRKEPKEVAWFDKPSTEPQKSASPEELTVAQRLYGDATTSRNAVDFEEDAAGRAEFTPIPNGVEVDQAEHERVMPEIRETLTEAGIGPTLARDLWGDVLQHVRSPYEGTEADAAADLRRRWGPDYDRKLAAAAQLAAKACARSPQIREALIRTNLGNSPNLIVKLARRAEALAGKEKRR